MCHLTTCLEGHLWGLVNSQKSWAIRRIVACNWAFCSAHTYTQHPSGFKVFSLLVHMSSSDFIILHRIVLNPTEPAGQFGQWKYKYPLDVSINIPAPWIRHGDRLKQKHRRKNERPSEGNIRLQETHIRWSICPHGSYWPTDACTPVDKWVCLKIGYTPNYSHLIGIMIINHWV